MTANHLFLICFHTSSNLLICFPKKTNFSPQNNFILIFLQIFSHKLLKILKNIEWPNFDVRRCPDLSCPSRSPFRIWKKLFFPDFFLCKQNFSKKNSLVEISQTKAYQLNPQSSLLMKFWEKPLSSWKILRRNICRICPNFLILQVPDVAVSLSWFCIDPNSELTWRKICFHSLEILSLD